jgi:hypothetical protein
MPAGVTAESAFAAEAFAHAKSVAAEIVMVGTARFFGKLPIRLAVVAPVP